jgi:hypothetical protein
MQSGQSQVMSDESHDLPKRNWPLICTCIIAALLAIGTAAGVIALYIANFNLLDWLE